MKSIQLQTTQNVKIDYEIATLLDRVLAFFIDLIAILIGCSFLWGVTFLLLWAVGAHEAFYVMTTGLILAPVMVFYTLGMETLNKGRTLGKMALKIQVIRVDGAQALFMDYFIRWVFRILDLWFSFGGLAAICVSGSARGQRIGGVLSNTTVVKSNPSMRTSLKRILNIDSRSSYEPVYPQVHQFKEADMLLVKQTLERYRKFRNSAHKEAIEELVVRVATEMEIPVPKKQKVQFLKTVIRDYIVLTR